MEKKSFKQRVVALVSAGALAASMAAMPALAFADNSASAGSQVGTGTTALNMITADDGSEHDASSENLAFTFPSALNYVIAANGTLTGPQADFSTPRAVIDNNSNFGIHVSSVDVDATSGWNFVNSAGYANASNDNTVQLSIGPAGDQIEAADYLTNWDASTNHNNLHKQWNMEANGAANHGDMVGLGSSGQAKNITANITSNVQFGTINWYVKAGPAPTA